MPPPGSATDPALPFPARPERSGEAGTWPSGEGCRASHGSSAHISAQQGTAQHRTSPHMSAQHRTAPHLTAHQRTAPHSTAYHHRALHITTHHCTPRPTITLYCVQCAFLHSVHSVRIFNREDRKIRGADLLVWY